MADELELSERAQSRLADLRYVGSLTDEVAEARGCHLVAVSHGADSASEHIELCWLVDDAGFIRDGRFRSPATGLSLIAYDLMVELCIGITVEQAAVVSPGHVKERLQLVYDQEEVELPWSLGAPFPVIVKAVNKAQGVVDTEPETAKAEEADKKAEKQAEWDGLGLFERVRRIEQVLDDSVRPMLASDGGGVDIVDLRERELIIQYNGACGSCSSSIGGTLQFLTDTLEEKLGIQMQIIVQGMEYENFVDL